MDHPTTDLCDHTIDRRSRVQRVRYVDIYPAGADSTRALPSEELRDWMASQARSGMTAEGHGKGIRILFDADLDGKQAREVLLWFLRDLEKREHPTELTDEQLHARLIGPDLFQAQQALEIIRQRAGVQPHFDDEELPF